MADEKTLVLAEKICAARRMITVQEFGRTYEYQNGVYTSIRSPKCDAAMHRMISAIDRAMTPGKRSDVIRNIEMLTAVPEDLLNPEGIFNFQDGLYDIRSNSFAAHDPQYLTTIQLPYRLQSSIDAPLWSEFLLRVTEGNQHYIDLLQEFCGYALMKSCRLEKALFLIGRGSNGKSVFSDTITKVFGYANVSSVSLENLSNPVMRCNIIGKYINIDSDLPRNAMDFEEAFRKITSGEPILFNEKFLPSYTMPTHCKLMYCLNEFPSIDDSSNAFYRRMILIPFNVEFDDNTKDVNLKSKLEAELPGIFRWCVQGWKRVSKNGFSKNSFMDKTIRELKVDNNPIIAFMEEEVSLDDKCKGITKKGLYKEFKQWAMDHGHKAPSFRKFNNRVYSEYRAVTAKDAQLSYGVERPAFWPNFSYKRQEKAQDRGEVFQEFETDEMNETSYVS